MPPEKNKNLSPHIVSHEWLEVKNKVRKFMKRSSILEWLLRKFRPEIWNGQIHRHVGSQCFRVHNSKSPTQASWGILASTKSRLYLLKNRLGGGVASSLIAGGGKPLGTLRGYTSEEKSQDVVWDGTISQDDFFSFLNRFLQTTSHQFRNRSVSDHIKLINSNDKAEL